MTQAVEQKTARLYEDIHPHQNSEVSIQNYLKTIGVNETFFKNKEILDCGCGGTGWGVELFLRSGAKKVTGMDLNPNWLPKLRSRFERYGDRLALRQGSALELPFESNSFDYVHCNGVLHHTTDWKKGLKELGRVVKPGGTVFIMLYGKFAPVGKIIHSTYRGLGKIIPLSWTRWAVHTTGIFKDPEISLLDAMYVPIENHLDKSEIESVLKEAGLSEITYFESYKWKNNRLFSHPLSFGRNINHNYWAKKPL